MLKTLLEFNVYEVTVTKKPEEAEAIIDKDKTDLVSLAMLIWGVNGTDVYRQLKQKKETAEIPVLMMSALHEAASKCKEAGADDFIAKPFEMEDLVSRIEEIPNKCRN